MGGVKKNPLNEGLHDWGYHTRQVFRYKHTLYMSTPAGSTVTVLIERGYCMDHFWRGYEVILYILLETNLGSFVLDAQVVCHTSDNLARSHTPT